MSQTIAFIGSGDVGGALARLSVAAGLNVVMSNSRGPESLARVVGEFGPRATAATSEHAARAGDLVVLSIPFHLCDRIPCGALVGKIVIDTMNYYPHRDGGVGELNRAELTSSQVVQRQLVGSTVVKALHNVDYVRLFTAARLAGASERSALPVAGDDPAAKGEVIRYMDAIGYDAVDAGALADSWRQEPWTPCFVTPYISGYPADLCEEEQRHWFREAPNAPVPRVKLTELLASAVRDPEGGIAVPGYVAGLRPDRA